MDLWGSSHHSLLELVKGPVSSLVDNLLGSGKVQGLDTSDASGLSGQGSSGSLSREEGHGSLGDGLSGSRLGGGPEGLSSGSLKRHFGWGAKLEKTR